MMKMLDWLKLKYPGACEVQSWQEHYEYRRRTGGTHRAATLHANDMRPDEARPVPKDDPADK